MNKLSDYKKMVYDSGELEKLSSDQLALESFVYRKNKEVMTKIKVCLKLSPK